MITLKIKKLHTDAKIPKYAHTTDAGLDLYTIEDFTLEPGQQHGFKTGIATEFPEGYVALLWDKSGLAIKGGITTMAGVIDAGYRGEWIVILRNTSSQTYEFKKGDKVAQALIQPIIQPEIFELGSGDEFSDSQRGVTGFGASGKQ